MRFYSGKSAVTSPAYTHMDSFSAGQCPWAVTGEGGQLLRAAVAVRAAYTDTRAEIKMLARQHVRDIAKHPEREDMLEEIYTEQIDELTLRIEGLRNQMQLAADKHNMIVNVNRTAKTVMEVFDTILSKDSLTKADVDFIIERITVYEDHIDIKLRPDIDMLLKTGTMPERNYEETAVNFEFGTGITEESPQFAVVTTSTGKILSVNVISDGEIFDIYSHYARSLFRSYSATLPHTPLLKHFRGDMYETRNQKDRDKKRIVLRNPRCQRCRDAAHSMAQ